MQLLAVAYGGALHQHLPDVVGTDLHRPQPMDQLSFGEHVVHIEPGTHCHDLLGSVIKVNSLHHQAVADPGAFTAVGWCIEDGVIEAWSPRSTASPSACSGIRRPTPMCACSRAW